MPKRAISGKDVIKILEKEFGFRTVRQKGSHRIYTKGNKGVTIPYHNKDLRRGTLRNIIKQSGMTLEEFLELL